MNKFPVVFHLTLSEQQLEKPQVCKSCVRLRSWDVLGHHLITTAICTGSQRALLFCLHEGFVLKRVFSLLPKVRAVQVLLLKRKKAADWFSPAVCFIKSFWGFMETVSSVRQWPRSCPMFGHGVLIRHCCHANGGAMLPCKWGVCVFVHGFTLPKQVLLASKIYLPLLAQYLSSWETKTTERACTL